ncbi:dihydroorotase, multifunctional complex type [Leptospira inadai serovar Lyme str. 10]|uniref:Dihydroorotase, multifunctional complex type n=2 Tax=Leptospira inadai serovar Lyme TaxID=293084 RepID=V6HGS6_9LEPT|nr:amidohydrolase family protein [Leptospira inadai]EQA34815.1 dihydroorotase, multifunctional complex type [Leptospira inadai serovar Lyme str. 10]PNV75884.1 amidohydrolase [Leptospira inadai serovar Lyme]
MEGIIRRISGRFQTSSGSFEAVLEIDPNTGLISAIHRDSLLRSPEQGDLSFDPDQSVIFSGFGDIHVHAREDETKKHIYKEDFHSAGLAAINGGVIHIADMPNNPSPPVNDETYLRKQELADRSPIRITLYAGIGPKTKPLTLHVPYKAFMGPSVGELFFHSNEQLEDTIRQYEGKNVSFHCEDPEVLEKKQGEFLHEDRRPPEAETLATDFALYLIEKYKLKGKLCHYSTGEGLQRIINAKRRGISVTCEVTPTHLYFDRTMLTDENRHWFQMNPPLRGPEDKTALLQGIRDGWIDYLATDHAPHSVEEKKRGTSGISQLDTYALFVTWLHREGQISLEKIAAICSENPGEFVNEFLPKEYGKGFGKLEPGYCASFTVLNFHKPTTFRKEDIKSKSGWSPFENVTFPGSILAVIHRGLRVK